MAQRRLRRDDYTVGWICALPIELAAAQELLDEEHEDVEHDENDHNLYSLGRMADQNIVIVCLPAGLIGNNPAAAVATQMKATFKSVRFGLMVGIGGGVPSTDSDIRLGDVVISQPQKGYGGVIQYDFVKTVPSGFQRTGFINCPPLMLLSAIAKMRASHLRQRSKLAEYASKLSHLQEFNREAAGPDILYEATYEHEGGSTCSSCRTDKRVDRPRRRAEETIVHYGIIASGNQVMRHATERDTVSAEFGGVLCFEMEAAGLMNSFPCLIIRGICDYSDSHKNKRWQAYAAGVSAACAKEVLSIIPPADIAKTSPLEDIFGKDSRGQIEQDYKDAHIREGESASLQDTYCIGASIPFCCGKHESVPANTCIALDLASEKSSASVYFILSGSDISGSFC